MGDYLFLDTSQQKELGRFGEKKHRAVRVLLYLERDMG